MAKEKTERVRILSEDLALVRVGLEKTRLEMRITYQTSDIPYGYVIKPLNEVYPGKEEQFQKEWKEKKGKLFEEWPRKRGIHVKADIAERRKLKPFEITV